MRFEYLVAAVAAGGIVIGTAMHTLVSQPPQFFATAPAQGAIPTKITFGLADLNPLRLIYDEVMNEVANGKNRIDFPVSKPLPSFDYSYINRMQSQYNSEFSAENIGSINGQNAANQVREFNNRMQDMRNYANGPAGWHGMPPH